MRAAWQKKPILFRVATLLCCCLLVTCLLSGCASGDGDGGFADRISSFFSDLFSQKEPDVSDENQQSPPDDSQTLQTGFYGEDGELVSFEGELAELLYAAANAGAKELNVYEYGYDAALVKEELNRFFFTNPEIFYLETSYSLHTVTEQDVVAKIVLKYKYAVEDIPAMSETYKAHLARILSGVPSEGSDFDKVLYLHDYLVRNYSYDYEGMRLEQAGTGTAVCVRDAYTFFESGTGVCQAYMLAFLALCEEVGIPCLPVVSDEMNHAWNMVELDGEWYHVDVTWDDAGGEQSAVYPSIVSYKFFLQSDESLRACGRTAAWEADHVAEGALYDAVLWRDATTPLLHVEGTYYCALFDTDDDLVKLYCGSATEMVVAHVFEQVCWYSEKGYYRAAWVGLVRDGEQILLNTANAIFCYEIETGVMQKLCDLEEELAGAQIFGLCGLSESGELSFVVAQDYHGEYTLGTWQIP